MALIRKHWLITFVTTAVLAIGSTWWVVSSLVAEVPGPTASPEPDPGGGQGQAPDVATYTHIEELRRRLCLHNEDLAAMGCSQEQAEQVFTALRTWYEANKANWQTARQAKGATRKALRQAFQKIHMGPRDEALLAGVPDLKTAAAEAVQQENAAVAAAMPSAETLLSADQKSVWATARANATVPRRYRYAPSLTAEQLKALRQAMRTRARRLRAAPAPTERARIEADFQAAESQVLSSAQKTAMAAAGASIEQRMPAVLVAFEKILPLPEALKPPEIPAGALD